jgi:hypothetical protein
MTKTLLSTLMIVAMLPMLLLAGGCEPGGYSMESLYPSQVDSISIEMAVRGAEVYRRQIETRLTEAVVKQIQVETPYTIQDREKADSVLAMEVVAVVQEVAAFNPDSGDPIDKQMTFIVNFTWTDLNTGELLADRKGFQVTDVYIPDVGQDFFLGSQSLIEKTARRLVEKMQSDW